MPNYDNWLGMAETKVEVLTPIYQNENFLTDPF
jgi:hypothetical protein